MLKINNPTSYKYFSSKKKKYPTSAAFQKKKKTTGTRVILCLKYKKVTNF